jgi:hypothetical protein
LRPIARAQELPGAHPDERRGEDKRINLGVHFQLRVTNVDGVYLIAISVPEGVGVIPHEILQDIKTGIGHEKVANVENPRGIMP